MSSKLITSSSFKASIHWAQLPSIDQDMMMTIVKNIVEFVK